MFAILFGIALTRVPEKTRQPILRVAESLAQTMFPFTNIVMYYAPIGVGAAMAYTVEHMGMTVLLPLAKLLLTAWGALLAFLLLVFLLIVLMARLPLGRFLKAVAEPATIAFATSTSEAALPRAMESMEEFGVPPGDRRVRHSCGLQLQSRWFDSLSGHGFDFCGAGRRHPDELDAATLHGIRSHAHQQRRGRRAARSSRRAIGHGCDVSSAHGADLHHSRR